MYFRTSLHIFTDHEECNSRASFSQHDVDSELTTVNQVLYINMVVVCLFFQSLMAASCQQSNSSYLMGWRHADEASKHSHWLILIHESVILIPHKLSLWLDGFNDIVIYYIYSTLSLDTE